MIAFIKTFAMRRIRLYIAASLDGFIARRDGAIDWLSSVEKAGEDYGYTEFLGSIDTTLMGYATYAQVLTFGAFPYSEQKNYVFSRQQRPPDGNPVTFVAEDPAAFRQPSQAATGRRYLADWRRPAQCCFTTGRVGR